MRILVVSDTHGNYPAALVILEQSAAQLLVHLGDEVDDARTIEPLLEIPLLKVAGNCDHGATEPREIVVVIAGKRVFITHGDRYRVKLGLESLKRKAAELQAEVVLFGHTHIPGVWNEDGVLLVNPGTLMAGSSLQSYALLTITDEAVDATIVPFPENPLAAHP